MLGLLLEEKICKILLRLSKFVIVFFESISKIWVQGESQVLLGIKIKLWLW